MPIATLTALELQKRLAAGETVTVIDVRTPVEYAEVHATSAVNIPLDRVSKESLATAGCADCGRLRASSTLVIPAPPSACFRAFLPPTRLPRR